MPETDKVCIHGVPLPTVTKDYPCKECERICEDYKEKRQETL